MATAVVGMAVNTTFTCDSVNTTKKIFKARFRPVVFISGVDVVIDSSGNHDKIERIKMTIENSGPLPATTNSGDVTIFVSAPGVRKEIRWDEWGEIVGGAGIYPDREFQVYIPSQFGRSLDSLLEERPIEVSDTTMIALEVDIAYSGPEGIKNTYNERIW